jgi:hypothetical protein
MALLEYQIALGRRLRAAGRDAAAPLTDYAQRAEIAALVGSPDFCFTRGVQRSWCRGRSAEMARLTLSILPRQQRLRLVDDWVERGAGTALDPAIEMDAFLEFVASRLPDPSHQLTVCRMEQAVHRASEASLHLPRMTRRCSTTRAPRCANRQLPR